MTKEPEQKQRNHPCWISAYNKYTANLPTPERFTTWAAVSAIAGAMERRCWIKTGAGPLYPNMFILLVAPPGVGKDFALNPAKELWLGTGRLNISPAAMTHKGMIDHLGDLKCQGNFTDPRTKQWTTYHSLLISVPELGVLMPSNDLAFMSSLNDLYGCGSVYEERSRMKGEVLRIENPHIHLISGTQPKFIGTLFPEEAYGMGFTSRIIMVYWGHPSKSSIFGANKYDEKMKKSLTTDLHHITELVGEFSVNEDAMKAIEIWHSIESEHDKPVHSKLMHYNARRIMHILKLSMVFSASQGDSRIITLDHFNSAKDLLLETEADMPEIFKEISAGGQTHEIEEAFNFVMKLHMTGKKPVSEHRLVHFLSTKVPVNQIQYIIDTMLRANMIELYVPAHLKGLNLPASQIKEKLYTPVALNTFE